MASIADELRTRLRSISRQWPLPEALAGLGALLHAFFSWGHLHGQVSVLDEGLYLYKGWLFATGRFAPFEDFGPYTNHMPLSFLIPGWVQVAFGPGIRTGRAVAFALSLLMLVGLWLVGRRLAGRWWAAVPVWLVALNPFLTKVYAQALSQVLVAAMLLWVLVLTLGRDRPRWQWLLGSGLAGAVALTRINLLPLPILLVGYLLWVHGRRAWPALAAAAVVLVVGHLAFWPQILKLWSYWLPQGITPFLDPWREPANAIFAWDPVYSAGTRWGVFVMGMRRHLAAVMGVAAVLLSWPRLPADERASDSSKAALVLAALFVGLTAEHAWAALANNYCVFCFQMYLAFFSPIGLLLLGLVATKWLPRLPWTHTLALLLVGLLLALDLGIRDVESAARELAITQIPRVGNLRLLPGSTALSGPLEVKLGLAQPALVRWIEAGFLLWVLGSALTLAYLGYQLLRGWPRGPVPAGLAPALAVLLALWVVPNGVYLGNRFRTYDCGGDVVTAVEQAGRRINEALAPGSVAYWKGSLSPAPLLYAPEVHVYPPQLNRVYSYRLSGDSQALYRLGLWNPELDRIWRGEADYLLVSEEYHDDRIAEALSNYEFDILLSTPPTDPCRPESSIHIYRRIR